MTFPTGSPPLDWPMAPLAIALYDPATGEVIGSVLSTDYADVDALASKFATPECGVLPVSPETAKDVDALQAEVERATGLIAPKPEPHAIVEKGVVTQVLMVKPGYVDPKKREVLKAEAAPGDAYVDGKIVKQPVDQVAIDAKVAAELVVDEQLAELK